MSIVRLDTGEEPEDDSELVHALRLRAADALERAYRFLETQPDGWALLRAQVLCEARPPADLARKLAEKQGPDGSLPIGTLISGGGLGYPAIDHGALTSAQQGLLGTLEGLCLSGDAQVLHADWVETSVRFLESQQEADGAYRIPIFPGTNGEPESDGQALADLFFTGMVAGILGRTPVSKTANLEAAGDFVTERFNPDLVEHDGFSALMACAHFYTNVPHDEADEALQWCGRALEKGFRSRQLDAVAVVRVLLTCDAQAMPGATFDVVELLERLLEEQAGDGGFAELALGGPESRTTQTFDAMLGIVRLCAAIDAGASD